MNLPGLMPDWMIKERVKISPLASGEKRPGKISYGLTSFGYDARLGYEFKVFSNIRHPATVVDPKCISKDSFETAPLNSDESGTWVLVPPHGYILGETLETFEIPRDVLAICVGKSTLARCGLIVNVTPLEPEWCGKVTIEISNSSPLPAKVYAGEGVMQILFFRGCGEPLVSYRDKQGKYDQQAGLTLPKVD